MAKNAKTKVKAKATIRTEPIVVNEDLAQAFETGGICLRLRRGSPGFRAGVDSEHFEAGDADKSQLSMSKRLIDSDAYREIKRCHNDVAHYLRHKAIPVPSLDKSYYFIPTQVVESALKYVKAKMKEHDEKLVPAFVADYDTDKKEAKRRLKHLYDETDYPSAAAVASMFYIKIQLQQRSTPTALKTIDEELFLEAQKELRQSFTQAANEARAYLREELLGFLKETTERLSAKADDGRPKAFHASSIEKIEEFLQFFDKRNVLSDDQMKEIVERLRKQMRGVDVESIRDDAKFRAQVATQMGQIQSELDKLVTAAPRKIRVRNGKEAA